MCTKVSFAGMRQLSRQLRSHGTIRTRFCQTLVPVSVRRPFLYPSNARSYIFERPFLYPCVRASEGNFIVTCTVHAFVEETINIYSHCLLQALRPSCLPRCLRSLPSSVTKWISFPLVVSPSAPSPTSGRSQALPSAEKEGR